MSYRLDEYKLKKYFSTDLKIQDYKIIEKIEPIIQENYGKDFDCVLTSITTILYSKLKNIESTKRIYNKVETIGKKYLYNGDLYGVFPFFIKFIFDKSLKEYNLYKYPTKQKYLKNIGFNFNTIKNNIKNNIPMILSLTNDGRNYYKNHSIVLIGYCIINNKKMLIAYDNWYKDKAFIDYEKLSIFSSLNY